MDKFMHKFCSDDNKGKEELDELMNRFLHSAERNVDGMSFDDYLSVVKPRHPYDGLNEEGVREYERTDAWLSRKHREERNKELDDEFRMTTFGPLEPEEEQARDEVEIAVDPPHYKEIVPGMQYMQMMQYMLADFKGVEAHALGHVYKYLTRLGKKDNKLQDAKKALWYLNALVRHYEGKDIIDD